MESNKNSMRSIEAIDLQEINNALEVLKVKLSPYLNEATPGDKEGRAKMSDKSFAFVTRILERCQQNVLLVPAFVNMEEHKAHFDYLEQLRQLEGSIKFLNKATQDSLLLANCEIYSTSLNIYGYIKAAAKNNVSGAQGVYEDLKIRFEAQGNRKLKKSDTLVE